MYSNAPHGDDRGLGVGQRDVNVQGKRRLPSGQLTHRAVQSLVAVARTDLDVTPDRKWMHAGHCRAQADSPQGFGQLRSRAGKLRGHIGYPLVMTGLNLHRRAVRFAAYPCGQAFVQTREDVIGAMGQAPVSRVEEHDLLLDADGPRLRSGRFVPRRPLRCHER